MHGSLRYCSSTTICLVLLLILAFALPRRAAAQEKLFYDVDRMEQNLSAQQRQLLQTIKGRPIAVEVRIVHLANAPATLLQRGKALTLNVAPGKRFVAVGKKVHQRGPADISWAGPLQNQYGWATLVLSSEGLTGTLRSGTSKSGFVLYRFEPIGGGLQAIIRVDESRFPPEHGPEHSTGVLHEYNTRKDSSGGPPKNTIETDQGGQDPAQNNTGPYIDVLVVYTSSVANAVGDIGGLIQTAVDETNQSYQNSNIYASVALAHTAQVGYDESGRSFEDHVALLEGRSDGTMDNVHGLRNQYLADVVVLLVDAGFGAPCGFASAIKATQATAFAAVNYICATGNYSFAHEIGHLQGARHDTYVDDTNEPFQYGHGYVDPNNA